MECFDQDELYQGVICELMPFVGLSNKKYGRFGIKLHDLATLEGTWNIGNSGKKFIITNNGVELDGMKYRVEFKYSYDICDYSQKAIATNLKLIPEGPIEGNSLTLGVYKGEGETYLLCTQRVSCCDYGTLKKQKVAESMICYRK